MCPCAIPGVAGARKLCAQGTPWPGHHGPTRHLGGSGRRVIFFNNLFYFEIISDSKEVVKIVRRVPVYPSPGFRHDKIFTAPGHISNTRKLVGVPDQQRTPRPPWTSPAMGTAGGGVFGVREVSSGRRPPAGRGRAAPGWGPAPPLLSPATWHQAFGGHVARAPHPTGRQACRPQNLQTVHRGRPEGPVLRRASRGSNLLC